jgi:hypothetical protein
LARADSTGCTRGEQHYHWRVKSTTQPDTYLRYCPDWTANNKSGRPKKDARKKSVLEGATGKKGAKRASGVKRARGYCQSCGILNHVTMTVGACHRMPTSVQLILQQGQRRKKMYWMMN